MSLTHILQFSRIDGAKKLALTKKVKYKMFPKLCIYFRGNEGNLQGVY